MKKIALLGSADALKPKIILENMYKSNNFKEYEFYIITNDQKGIFVEYSKKINLKYIILEETYTFSEIEHDKILSLNFDLIVSLGWPRKISISTINCFKFGGLNCHGSVLPDYKGQRSYMHYWANLSEYYGASIHYLTENFDEGKVVAQNKLKLFKEETPEILHYRTAELCAILLFEAFLKVFSNYEGFTPLGRNRFFKAMPFEKFVEIRKYNLNKSKNEYISTDFTEKK